MIELHCGRKDSAHSYRAWLKRQKDEILARQKAKPKPRYVFRVSDRVGKGIVTIEAATLDELRDKADRILSVMRQTIDTARNTEEAG